MVDITPVIHNAYEAPLLCFGKTCSGRRCKLKSLNSYTCYGVELPVCKYHDRQNAIYKWSVSRSMLHVPDKIKNYLIFYKHCRDLEIDEWLSVIIAAELYKTKLFLGPEQLLFSLRIRCPVLYLFNCKISAPSNLEMFWELSSVRTYELALAILRLLILVLIFKLLLSVKFV